MLRKFNGLCLLKSRFGYVFTSFFVVSVFVAFVSVVNAQDIGALNTQAGSLLTLVGTLTQVAIAAAFLFFFYNLAKFLLSAKSSEATEAKSGMVWSIIAVTIIVSIWGITTFIRTVFLGDTANDPGDIVIPGVTTGGGGSSCSTAAPNQTVCASNGGTWRNNACEC